MATYNGKVLASLNDSRESSTGSVFPTASIISLVSSATNRAGFRFVSVPEDIAGATINSASIKWYYSSIASDWVGRIYAEAAASPAIFSTTEGELSDRTLTTEYVEFDNNDFDAGAGVISGLAAIIQELVDAFTPTEIVILTTYVSGAGNQVVLAYDNDFDDDGAELTIDYTPAGGSRPRSINVQLRF